MRLSALVLSTCALALVAGSGRAQSTDSPSVSPGGLAEAFSRAQKAYAASDWVAVRDALTRADSFSPAHPLVLYHLARAEALTGNADGALRQLKRMGNAGGSERDIAGQCVRAAAWT